MVGLAEGQLTSSHSQRRRQGNSQQDALWRDRPNHFLMIGRNEKLKEARADPISNSDQVG